MKITQAIEEFWTAFCDVYPQINRNESFQVWYFGIGRDNAEELANLVLTGKKRATASLVWEYENTPEDAPLIGGYSVVTDYARNPKCIVRTTELRVVPFNEVDAEFAFDEGEGDQSLDYWRQIHWDYFSRKCAEIGREPSLEMLVNCERFELLYPITNF